MARKVFGSPRKRAVVALLLAGAVIGALFVGNAGAHFTTNTKHLGKHAWQQFIKKKADNRYDQRLWAVVEGDGTLVRGNRAKAVIRVADGLYRVRFNRNVRKCAYQATVGSPTSPAPAGGQVTVGHDDTNVRGVFVLTTDTGGTIADQPFHLAVNC